MTKNEATIIADIRNKLGPIQSFFELEEMIQHEIKDFGENHIKVIKLKQFQNEVKLPVSPLQSPVVTTSTLPVIWSNSPNRL